MRANWSYPFWSFKSLLRRLCSTFRTGRLTFASDSNRHNDALFAHGFAMTLMLSRVRNLLPTVGRCFHGLNCSLSIERTVLSWGEKVLPGKIPQWLHGAIASIRRRFVLAWNTKNRLFLGFGIVCSWPTTTLTILKDMSMKSEETIHFVLPRIWSQCNSLSGIIILSILCSYVDLTQFLLDIWIRWSQVRRDVWDLFSPVISQSYKPRWRYLPLVLYWKQFASHSWTISRSTDRTNRSIDRPH